jgi:tRNA A64-2'-O-ribosylphosphate transferase
MWLSPSTTVLPHLSDSTDFIPVLCICVSHQVNAGFDRRSGGFTYVQGSADDHELWGGVRFVFVTMYTKHSLTKHQGLTPSDFWQHKDQLLASSRHDLPQLIFSLVDNRGTDVADTITGNFSPSSISRVGGRIRICTLSEVPPSPLSRLLSLEESTPSSGDVSAAYILITPATPNLPCDTAPQPSPPTLSMHLAEGKKGQEQLLREILPRSMAFIRKHLNEGRIVVIACTNGKDASVGVALAAIQTCFDQDGHLSLHNPLGMCQMLFTVNSSSSSNSATKDAIRTKLQWIIASRPESNPSRATLKRVNEFLLSPVGFRAWQSPAQAA